MDGEDVLTVGLDVGFLVLRVGCALGVIEDFAVGAIEGEAVGYCVGFFEEELTVVVGLPVVKAVGEVDRTAVGILFVEERVGIKVEAKIVGE
jgi:hypothetical protein